MRSTKPNRPQRIRLPRTSSSRLARSTQGVRRQGRQAQPLADPGEAKRRADRSQPRVRRPRASCKARLDLPPAAHRPEGEAYLVRGVRRRLVARTDTRGTARRRTSGRIFYSLSGSERTAARDVYRSGGAATYVPRKTRRGPALEGLLALRVNALPPEHVARAGWSRIAGEVWRDAGTRRLPQRGSLDGVAVLSVLTARLRQPRLAR